VTMRYINLHLLLPLPLPSDSVTVQTDISKVLQ